MKKAAIFSECQQFRYELSRQWDNSRTYVLFIGLNPSTADEENDDPTLNKCVKYAKLWGYGGVFVVNIFAYRATNPNDMRVHNDPVGVDNDNFIKGAVKKSALIIAAWGNHGSFKNRSTEIKNFVNDLNYLKLNKSGEPSHPLYLRSDLKPRKWYF